MRYTAKEIKAFSKASAVAQEVLGSIRTVTAFGGQRKEEARWAVLSKNHPQDSINEYRFSQNLTEAKQIGIRKGIYLGICQGFAQVAIYISMAVTFWCKWLRK